MWDDVSCSLKKGYICKAIIHGMTPIINLIAIFQIDIWHLILSCKRIPKLLEALA